MSLLTPSSVLIAINFTVFILSYSFATIFLSYSLFRDQELKHALNKNVFSFVFGFCTLLLVMFLEEALSLFTREVSLQVWKTALIGMDLLMLVVIPMAFLYDFCCTKKRKATHRLFQILSLLICIFIFASVYTIHYKYLQLPSEEATEKVKQSIWETIQSPSTHLELLTLTGILLNAMMQGIVCANTWYTYYIQKLEETENYVEQKKWHAGRI